MKVFVDVNENHELTLAIIPSLQIEHMFAIIEANTHLGKEVKGMENFQSIFAGQGAVNIPVQMICAMDTTGRISPMRFRYETPDHTIETIMIAQIISRDEKHFVGIREKQFICVVEMYERQHLVEFRYNTESQKWRIFQFLS